MAAIRDNVTWHSRRYTIFDVTHCTVQCMSVFKRQAHFILVIPECGGSIPGSLSPIRFGQFSLLYPNKGLGGFWNRGGADRKSRSFDWKSLGLGKMDDRRVKGFKFSYKTSWLKKLHTLRRTGRGRGTARLGFSTPLRENFREGGVGR